MAAVTAFSSPPEIVYLIPPYINIKTLTDPIINNKVFTIFTTTESVPLKRFSGVSVSLPATSAPFLIPSVASDAKTFVLAVKLAPTINRGIINNPAMINFIDFIFILFFLSNTHLEQKQMLI